MTDEGVAFWFAACQPGSERMLKAEVARSHPLLRPAYSRPGLVTWKGDAGAFPDTVFARVAGVSYGPATDASQVVARAREAGTKRLHVWKREGEPAPEAREALLATGEFLPEERPKAGETVLDVIVADGEPAWVGAHTHRRGASPWAGGLYKIELPADAPSRAYLKLEEALAWSGVRPKAGETALEIGSSPGGASHALLRRGLNDVLGRQVAAIEAQLQLQDAHHRVIGPQAEGWIGLIPFAKPEDGVLDVGQFGGLVGRTAREVGHVQQVVARQQSILGDLPVGKLPLGVIVEQLHAAHAQSVGHNDAAGLSPRRQLRQSQ